ncbi:DUF1648 domain-containing protein [Macrococcus armenti]|uniref:DUF1648 domain-containing protein n=1 Tax=Macrococcus armenti TaxID=2875764 RepID=UPI001CC90BCF|nr:DUF1648 domain-containing protein [Macrococcus armenti]UBH16245.1 DUF1648 domain-containing protein [Macrococcus armenti]UBH18603.1 DUF1648 domain-containing protein [Macrococcus armenti]UBH20873.1 DUF1648 domain-containing protein [Macrococcus armenti]
MEAVITTIIVLCTGLLFLLNARYIRRNILFSVYVPDDKRTDNNVLNIARTYKRNVFIMSIFFAVINLILMAILHSELSFILFTLLLFLLIIAMIWIYRSAFNQMRFLKEKEDWMANINMYKAVDTSLMDEENSTTSYFYLIQILMLIAAVIYVIINYHTIPDTIATHWGLNGVPDDWSDKNIITVFFPAGMALFMIFVLWGSSKGLSFYQVNVNPANKEASKKYAANTKRNNEMLLHVISFIMTILFIFILVRPVLFGKEYMPPYIMESIIFISIVVVVFGIVQQISNDKKYRASAALNDKAPYHNEKNYIWGLFYYNKEDENVWVPKVSEFGMTLNMARPAAWFISFMIIVFPIIPIVIMIIMT